MSTAERVGPGTSRKPGAVRSAVEAMHSPATERTTKLTRVPSWFCYAIVQAARIAAGDDQPHACDEPPVISAGSRALHGGASRISPSTDLRCRPVRACDVRRRITKRLGCSRSGQP